jgi:hypothetical protein
MWSFVDALFGDSEAAFGGKAAAPLIRSRGS